MTDTHDYRRDGWDQYDRDSGRFLNRHESSDGPQADGRAPGYWPGTAGGQPVSIDVSEDEENALASRFHFDPVPVRERHDGWTETRQRRFIAALSEFACVVSAARSVGKTARSAYTLRNRRDAASFRAAWDEALGEGVAMVESLLFQRAVKGSSHAVVNKDGEVVYMRDRMENGLLMFLLRHHKPTVYSTYAQRLAVYEAYHARTGNTQFPPAPAFDFLSGLGNVPAPPMPPKSPRIAVSFSPSLRPAPMPAAMPEPEPEREARPEEVPDMIPPIRPVDAPEPAIIAYDDDPDDGDDDILFTYDGDEPFWPPQDPDAPVLTVGEAIARAAAYDAAKQAAVAAVDAAVDGDAQAEADGDDRTKDPESTETADDDSAPIAAIPGKTLRQNLVPPPPPATQEDLASAAPLDHLVHEMRAVKKLDRAAIKRGEMPGNHDPEDIARTIGKPKPMSPYQAHMAVIRLLESRDSHFERNEKGVARIVERQDKAAAKLSEAERAQAAGMLKGFYGWLNAEIMAARTAEARGEQPRLLANGEAARQRDDVQMLPYSRDELRALAQGWAKERDTSLAELERAAGASLLDFATLDLADAA